MKIGIKRLSILIALIALLVLPIYYLAHADPKGFEAENYRVGANVLLAQDEKITGGLLTAGANLDISGNVKGGLSVLLAPRGGNCYHRSAWPDPNYWMAL